MRSLTLTLVNFVIVLVLFFSTHKSFAQSEDKGIETGANVGSEWGFHIGSLLPNQIEGIEEILPRWGMRYGLRTGRGFIEGGAEFSKALGARFSTLSISLRGDIPVQTLVAQVFIGMDLHQVVAPTATETTYLGGGHVGGGIMALIGGDVWFRSDMKFSINPGTSLYIGFGFIFRFPDGGSGGSSD